MNETIRLTLTLMLISILSAMALAFVYEKTNPIIEQNKIGELNRALKEVLPEAEYFNEIKIPLRFPVEPEIRSAESKGIGRAFNALNEKQKRIGLVVLADAPGFQSIIKVLIGIDTNTTTIANIKILEHLETPGLGARIEEPLFLDQFKKQKLGAQDVDSITGATISSTAVIDSVKETTDEILKLLKEGKI